MFVSDRFMVVAVCVGRGFGVRISVSLACSEVRYLQEFVSCRMKLLAKHMLSQLLYKYRCHSTSDEIKLLDLSDNAD